MSDPHIPEPGSPEGIKAQVEADDEYDPPSDAEYEAWEEAQAEEWREVKAAVEKVRDGLDGLHKLGKVDFLLSIAKWINDKYRPPATRGHRRNRLRTDGAFARVFWEWYTAESGKQAILKREYKNLGYGKWEDLQAKFATHKASLNDSEKAFGAVIGFFEPLDEP